MPVHAVGLAAVPCVRSLPAPNVFGIRNRLKVIRIDASAIATEMIQEQAVWDRADVKFVGYAMGDSTMPADFEKSVAPAVPLALPYPAAALVFPDAAKEPVFEWHGPTE